MKRINNILKNVKVLHLAQKQTKYFEFYVIFLSVYVFSNFDLKITEQ